MWYALLKVNSCHKTPAGTKTLIYLLYRFFSVVEYD